MIMLIVLIHKTWELTEAELDFLLVNVHNKHISSNELIVNKASAWLTVVLLCVVVSRSLSV